MITKILREHVICDCVDADVRQLEQAGLLRKGAAAAAVAICGGQRFWQTRRPLIQEQRQPGKTVVDAAAADVGLAFLLGVDHHSRPSGRPGTTGCLGRRAVHWPVTVNSRDGWGGTVAGDGVGVHAYGPTHMDELGDKAAVPVVLVRGKQAAQERDQVLGTDVGQNEAVVLNTNNLLPQIEKNKRQPNKKDYKYVSAG